MSDADDLQVDETPEQPAGADGAIGGDSGLLIVPGGIGPDLDDEDLLAQVEAGSGQDAGFAAEADADVEPTPSPEAQAGRQDSQFTLDELVAELAGVSSVDTAAPAAAAAVSAAPERIDPLAAAMSDAFAGSPTVEAEMWTRVPFWLLGVAWIAFVGLLTYLQWPTASEDLQGTSLYQLMVYGGVALVVMGGVIGAVIWSRARSHADPVDRAVVSRSILLRAVGWTASGVAVWVIAMIALSLHSLDVIP